MTSPHLRTEPQSVTQWEDLSHLLPRSRGWMHSGVAIDQANNIICAHPEGHELLRIDPEGPVTAIKTPLTEIHSIATTSRDGVEVFIIADPGHRFVETGHHPVEYTDFTNSGRAVILDGNGTVIQELQCPDHKSYTQSSWRPTSVAVDDERYGGTGDIWVADGYGQSLVHRFASNGSHIATLDGSATGKKFSCPHGIMLRKGTSGVELYVADRSNKRIVVIDANGLPVRVFGEEHVDSPSSMALVNGRLYVTELHGGVACFEGSDYVGSLEHTRLRSHQEDAWPNLRTKDGIIGPEPMSGSFNSPHGIVADDGWIYVTEWLVGGRLLRIALDHPAH